MIDKSKVDYDPGIIYGPSRNIRTMKKERTLQIVREKEGYIITFDITQRSSAGKSSFSFYTVLGVCVAKGVDKAIIIHNHPNGVCRASQLDVNEAISLRDELKEFNITLVDSVIVTTDDEWSIAEHDWKYVSAKDV